MLASYAPSIPLSTITASITLSMTYPPPASLSIALYSLLAPVVYPSLVTPHSVHINPTLDLWDRRSWRGKPVLSPTNAIGVVVTVAPIQFSSPSPSVYVRLLGTIAIADAPSSGPPAMNDISTCAIWSIPVATAAVAAYTSPASSWSTCLKWRNFFASNFLKPLMGSSVSEGSLAPEPELPDHTVNVAKPILNSLLPIELFRLSSQVKLVLSTRDTK